MLSKGAAKKEYGRLIAGGATPQSILATGRNEPHLMAIARRKSGEVTPDGPGPEEEAITLKSPFDE